MRQVDKDRDTHKCEILQSARELDEICTIHTANFVTPVPAVVLMVALAAAVNACAIVAFKLIWTAGGMS